jgi:hypothetical protein
VKKIPLIVSVISDAHGHTFHVFAPQSERSKGITVKQRTRIRLGALSFELQTEGLVSIVAITGIIALGLLGVLAVLALQLQG